MRVQRSAVAAIVTLATWSCGCAATGPAFDPAYATWAAHRPGTSVTYDVGVTDGYGKRSTQTLTVSLSDVTPDGVKLVYQRSGWPDDPPATRPAPTTTILPARDSPSEPATPTRTERVEVDGRQLVCDVYTGDVAKRMVVDAVDSDDKHVPMRMRMATTYSAAACRAVPGLIVWLKADIKLGDYGTAGFDMRLTKVDPK